MSSKIATLVAAMIALGLFAGSAMAAYPTSIAGTWTVQANQSTGTMNITQGLIGTCRALSGNLGGTALVGFYCPTTGRFNFERTINGVTIQYYSGNVSQIGSHLFMGGIFGVPITSGGPLGEYNFSAVK